MLLQILLRSTIESFRNFLPPHQQWNKQSIRPQGASSRSRRAHVDLAGASDEGARRRASNRKKQNNKARKVAADYACTRSADSSKWGATALS